jgi:protein-S-isoprenylcysteine O-methyltransferase Ste14
MYVGLVSVVLGEALLLADVRLLYFAAIIWLSFHLWVLAYEEPILKHLFGAEYETYRAHVGRWLPRLTPWKRA